MKTWIVLALILLGGSASAIAFAGVSIAEVASAVTHARTAEPAQLLVCGAALLALSVALRRTTFDAQTFTIRLRLRRFRP